MDHRDASASINCCTWSTDFFTNDIMFVQVVDEAVVDAVIAATETGSGAAPALMGAAGSAVRRVRLGVGLALHLVAGGEAEACRGDVSWRAAPAVRPPGLRPPLHLEVQPDLPDPALQGVVVAPALKVALPRPCRSNGHWAQETCTALPPSRASHIVPSLYEHQISFHFPLHPVPKPPAMISAQSSFL